MIPEFSGDFIQWLRGFYYTAQTGSMTAAAELMKRNQSAITHQIKCLEEELKVKLFAGVKGRRTLTPEGKRLFNKAVQIFEVITELTGAISDIELSLNGKITIASTYTFIEYYLPKHIALFSSQHPAVSFCIKGKVHKEEMLEAVNNGQADCAFLPLEHDFSSINGYPELNSYPLTQSNMVLISPLNGPYAVTHPPYPDELSHLPFLYHANSDFMEPYMLDLLSRYGIHPKNGHQICQCGPLKRYVAQGMGVAIVDGFACQAEDRAHLNIVSLAHMLPMRKVGIVLSQKKASELYLQVFLRFMFNNCQSKKEIFLKSSEREGLTT